MSQLRNVLCLGTEFLVFLGLTAIPVLGATPSKDPANWDNVKQLSAGEEILVVQKDAKSFQGKLQTVSDATIVMSLTTGEQTIPKDSVLRVSKKGASHRWRNLALGAGIGFAGGAGIGAASSNPTYCGRGCSAGLGAVIGLAAGAAVGAALPTGRWREIYRAQ